MRRIDDAGGGDKLQMLKVKHGGECCWKCIVEDDIRRPVIDSHLHYLEVSAPMTLLLAVVHVCAG